MKTTRNEGWSDATEIGAQRAETPFDATEIGAQRAETPFDATEIGVLREKTRSDATVNATLRQKVRISATEIGRRPIPESHNSYNFEINFSIILSEATTKTSGRSATSKLQEN